MEARSHVRRAQQALASLPANPYREALHALAEYVLNRRR
jgi:geranylgeranyl pyrophosphate synthase